MFILGAVLRGGDGLCGMAAPRGESASADWAAGHCVLPQQTMLPALCLTAGQCCSGAGTPLHTCTSLPHIVSWLPCMAERQNSCSPQIGLLHIIVHPQRTLSFSASLHLYHPNICDRFVTEHEIF